MRAPVAQLVAYAKLARHLLHTAVRASHVENTKARQHCYYGVSSTQTGPAVSNLPERQPGHTPGGSKAPSSFDSHRYTMGTAASTPRTLFSHADRPN